MMSPDPTARRRRAGAILATLVSLALAACGPEPPFIRDLKYAPNAANVGREATISGTVAYTDPDNDLSYSTVELVDPAGGVVVSEKTPIDNVGQGVVGSVNFTVKFTPTLIGDWTFGVTVFDLRDAPSNKLTGPIKVLESIGP